MCVCVWILLCIPGYHGTGSVDQVGLEFATCLTVIFLSRSNKESFLFLMSPLLIHFINKTKNFEKKLSFSINVNNLKGTLKRFSGDTAGDLVPGL